MIETLIALACAGSAWLAFITVDRKDRLVAARVALLVPAASELRPPTRAVSTLEALGRRFPGRKPLTLDVSSLDLGSDLFRGLELIGAAGGALLGLAAGTLAILVAPVLGWTGYRLPRIWLRRRLSRRREHAAAALPDALDLMAVCTHAGLNIALTLKRVAARTRGTLGEELSRTVEEVELGVPRQTALRSLAERNLDGELEGLVKVLENSERFGTQVSAALETFADEVRMRRRRSAEEQARKAPIKILFPLVFLILPAFVLLSVVPLLLSTFASLGF